jgi:hypothetical protein
MSKEMSLAELLAAVEQRKSTIAKLKLERDTHLKSIEDLDKQIKGLGGDVDISVKKKNKIKTTKKTSNRRKRAKNDVSLTDSIEKILTTSVYPMRVKDIITAVEATGYKSNSKSFYSCVATALSDNKKFVKAGRGLYTIVKVLPEVIATTPAPNVVLENPNPFPVSSPA